MSHAYPITQVINAPQHLSVYDLLEDQAERTPNAPAIVAPGRASLAYGRLRKHINDTVQTLQAMGVNRNDRVALVLPNGAEMAVAFLAVAACATCAPLNPAYSANEFDLYLAALGVKVLIVLAGMNSPARDTARARGLRIIELSPVLEAEAGFFTLAGKEQTCTARCEYASPGDIALLLHTTGTTSWPKIVPLTQVNIWTAAHNLRVAFELEESDRCLNVMPLFHSHGLKGMVLPSLVAGANIVCTLGFSAPKFFEWMAEFRPTWYSAVPTIHQEILAHAAFHRKIIAECPLRFIRSSSASLPPQVLEELEKTFNAPVIESYGTTEASMITCNPLPPRKRKAGSGGVVAGQEVAIMNEVGTLLLAGEIGEIVVRGPTVMQGYDNNPAANESAFTHGWFRTGDAGYLDTDGYLFIVGRHKEIINRGGEKIAPREVDEVLMDHPAVAQAVTFAVPHARLGEDIAAAVVLHPDAVATDSDIRQFAATRLAAFKVPQQVLIVDDTPKGPTGKLQRIGLAEKLGLTVSDQAQPAMRTDYRAPRTPVEEMLARLWAEVLDVERVGIHDDFFELGGYSLQAVSLFATIERVTGKMLPIETLLWAPTVVQLATLLCQEGGSTSRSSLVPIQPVGSKPPLFCLPGHGGNLLIFRDLARYLGREQPVYGLQAQHLDGEQALYTPVEDIAAHYIQEILTVQPQGPFFLAGFCFGGLVAFEMAQQLQRQGHESALPILFEVYRSPSSPSITAFLRFRVESLRLFMFTIANLAQLRPKELMVYLEERVKQRIKKRMLRIEHKWSQLFGRFLSPALRKAEDNNILAARAYIPQVYHGRIIFVLDSETPVKGSHNPALTWGKLAAGGLEVHRVPGQWSTIFREPHVQVLAERLRACLDQAQTQTLCKRICPPQHDSTSSPDQDASQRSH